jgi:hypothetical protein
MQDASQCRFSGSPFLAGSSHAGSPFLNSLLPTSPLIGGVPSLVSSHFTGPSLPFNSPDSALKREDYLNVNFWYRRDWLNHIKDGSSSTDINIESARGKTLMSKEINKNSKYIKGTDGKPVDGWKLRDIQAHARAIWTSFQAVGHAPPTWGKADVEVASAFRHEMRTKFPEFAYCENDWNLTNLPLNIILPGTATISRALKSKRTLTLLFRLAPDDPLQLN